MSQNESEDKNKKVGSLLETMIGSSGLQLEFKVTGDLDLTNSNVAEVVSGDTDDENGAPAGGRMGVEFTGPDTPLLTARNAELLNAMEHIAVKALRLEPEDHDRVSFDADSYKVKREHDLRELAKEAVGSVLKTSKPYAFFPMTSRDRRLLHLVLSESGMTTASAGEGPRRHVVLYPQGYKIDPRILARPDHDDSRPGNVRAVTASKESRVDAVRNSFRRR